MKHLSVIFLILVQYSLFAQRNSYFEKPPVFGNCKAIAMDSIQQCFDKNVYAHIYKNLKVPNTVLETKYKGEASVLFEVDTMGRFQVIYVDAMFAELKTEIKRVFSEFPTIKPATYNGRAINKQYTMPIRIPLAHTAGIAQDLKKESIFSKLEQRAKSEFDSVSKSLEVFSDNRFSSQLNIPFIHNDYSRFDRQMNLVGTNSHTASKPFVYEEVSKYYNFNAEKENLKKNAETWFGKKLWNEHFVQLQAKDYWLSIDPVFDLQLGTDTGSNFNSTYNNTRGFFIQGGLGKRVNFFASVFESQGRFAEYINRYSETLKAFGPDPAIIPGRGIAKRFKTDSYDYPVAEGYLSYALTNYINIQFGHGKNFIGDGYRSLLLADVTSPHPFLKLNTKFWKLKYTNTWLWLKDVRPEVTEDGAFLTKYIANHYLSWNVSRRFNLGLFESVIWRDTNNRGFDINYLNPVIFYRAIEFQTGQAAGNAILGATAKYKLNDNVNIYSQFILDEFSLDDIKGGERSWKNKFGYQIGAKYFNAFKVNNLLLQFEYNRVRPFTYSHNTITLNYANANQPMAHLWGANFSEAILIARYHYKRWYANAKLIFGVRGLDFNDGIDNFSYGSDVYRNYNDRPFDNGVEIGQGIKTKIFNGNLQAGFIINPASNMKIFTDITVRDFDPETTTSNTFKNSTTWFNFGIRTDLFNWYFDN